MDSEKQVCHARDKVGLELVQVDVEGAIEAEGRGDRRDDLRNQAVEVGEARLSDIELVLADVEDRLVVDLRVGARDYERDWNGRLDMVFITSELCDAP